VTIAPPPLNYATAPFARGALACALTLEPAVAGTSAVREYNFLALAAGVGANPDALVVSYVVDLLADLGDSPVDLKIAYVVGGPSASVDLRIPGGAIAGTTYAIPLPTGVAPILSSLTELPAPQPGAPSGPAKWQLWALLGDYGRLVWSASAEGRTTAATARDVTQQHRLLTARGGSLDAIGAALGVARLIPAPYRDDPDDATIALYHLDDVVASVIDAMRSHPGVSHNVRRGVPGRFATGAQTTTGGLTIPNDDAFTIAATADFSVELFALDDEGSVGADAVFANKRARGDDDLGPGWSVERTAKKLHFIVADGRGTRIDVGAVPATAPSGWFHLTASIDRHAGVAAIALDGTTRARAPLGALAAVRTCADIGFGGTREGVSAFAGTLNEIRLSNSVRAPAVPTAPYTPDGTTIALYHLDETDDLVDDATGAHPGLAAQVKRGIVGRFGLGAHFAGDPLPRAHSEAENAFMDILRAGAWDNTGGGAVVVNGPYARYGYRQGAIKVADMTGTQGPVFVNDDAGVPVTARGLVTTADAGFIPTDVASAIARFTAAGRAAQAAIDYVGEWNGFASAWFAQEYALNKITQPYIPCAAQADGESMIAVAGIPPLDVNSSLTVEAFVRPQKLADTYDRAIATSDPQTNGSGWMLAISNSGSVDDVARWQLRDGTTTIDLFGNRDLADGGWHHVAGVADRATGVAALLVDGVEVAREGLGTLGALTIAGGATLGNSSTGSAPFAGDLDEIRLSSTARWSFHPVLGEDDDRYRCRLAIYEPYRVPNIATLVRLVRALSLPPTANATARAAQILLDPSSASPADAQFDIVEGGVDRPCASIALRVVPARLEIGESIARDGTAPATPPAYAAPASLEAIFRLNDMPGVSFSGEPARLVALRGAFVLEAIAARAAAIGLSSAIVVEAAYDGTRGGGYAAGCALDLSLATPVAGFDNGELAALVHGIGAEYVARPPGGADVVTVMSVPQSDLDISGPATLDIGAQAAYAIGRPPPPAGASFAWELLPCGPGDATLEPSASASCTMVGAAYGTVTLAVTCTTSGGAVLRGARDLRVAPAQLQACQAIGADGQTTLDPIAAAGAPESDVTASDMIRDSATNLDFANEAAHYGSLALITTIQAIVALAAAEPGAPRITVTEGFDAGASDPLRRVGRAAVLTPSDSTKLAAARLGALAHLAGCAYVEFMRYPPSIYVAVERGPRFGLVTAPIVDVWPNGSVDRFGRVQQGEAAAVGPPETGFNPATLVTYANPAVTMPAGPSPQLQQRAATMLDALVALLRNQGYPDKGLSLIDAYDPKALGVAGVGRGVLIRHSVLDAGLLAGAALQAGFEYAENRPSAAGGPAAFAAVRSAALPNPVPDDGIVGGGFVALVVQPSSTKTYDWCLRECAPASAWLSSQRNGAKLVHGDAFGTILVSADQETSAATPYACQVVSAVASPKISVDQYEDIINALEAFHPIGVEVTTLALRDAVIGFIRPPRWDDLPTAATRISYRIQR
jgi:hypothetical protein